jgi:carbamoyltransferase
VAIQEERLLRRKRANHPGASASLSIRYCLDTAGISASDLDFAVLCAAGNSRSPAESLRSNPLLSPVKNRLRFCTIPHHLGHAVAAFATSGFSDAAVLVVDGCGSPLSNLEGAERAAAGTGIAGRTLEGVREIVSFYRAAGVAVTPVWKQAARECRLPLHAMPLFWSLGSMYEAAARQIFSCHGDAVFDAAGKVMGLAAYGKPVFPPGDFFQTRGNEIVFRQKVPARFPRPLHLLNQRRECSDLAASVQLALEEALLFLVRRLRALAPSERLCFAGGVALNSVANERIAREGGFRDVYFMPAAEDSGTAIGAAYWGLWKLTGHNAIRPQLSDAAGKFYRDHDVDAAIASVPALQVTPTPDVLEHAADRLCAGKIVGWFQGRSELGPRALGQRSILCDPRPPWMKDHLNARVKFREPFRPFAPSVLLEKAEEWFHLPPDFPGSPYMLRVLPFRENRRALVPAVVHADGTGRVQTLTAEANGPFYELVRRFDRRTGVPMLLNTSFNIAGEPIVETPEDALWNLLLTNIDCCVIGDRMVEKQEGLRSALDLFISWIARDAIVPPRLDLRGPPGQLEIRCFHAGRRGDIERRLRDDPRLIRITVDTAWGPVVHLFPFEARSLLARCDGSRTGWQMLGELQQEFGAGYAEEHFFRSIANLRRAGIVTFLACPRPMQLPFPVLSGTMLRANLASPFGRTGPKP